MSSSTVDARDALASRVELNDGILAVELLDGRTITVPLAWYRRLLHATVDERGSWRLIGQGRGIHWPVID
jgi:hypothetical protein